MARHSSCVRCVCQSISAALANGRSQSVLPRMSPPPGTSLPIAAPECETKRYSSSCSQNPSVARSTRLRNRALRSITAACATGRRMARPLAGSMIASTSPAFMARDSCAPLINRSTLLSKLRAASAPGSADFGERALEVLSFTLLFRAHAARCWYRSDCQRSAPRRGRDLGEARCDDDAVGQCALRILENVDDLELERSPRCCLQMAARLAMARAEFGALSATYRRITTTVVTQGRPADVRPLTGHLPLLGPLALLPLDPSARCALAGSGADARRFGSAPRILPASCSRSLEETRSSRSSLENCASSTRWRSKFSCRAVIRAWVSASANCSSRRL